MAVYRNHDLTLKIEGFDEMIKKLQKAGRDVDIEVEKCFSKCAKTVTDTLVEKARGAGLAESLVNKIEREKWHKFGVFHFSVGWKKVKPSVGNPLPDVYIVMFFNYGTPRRTTKDGENRGEIKGRRFIKKAKMSAWNKVKKIQRDFIAQTMNDLKDGK